MFLVGYASLIVAMVTTWVVTKMMIAPAERLGALDHPSGRSSHDTPTPRIGGVAVFAGFVAGMAFAAYAAGLLFDAPSEIYWRGLMFAAGGMFLVGLIDDLRKLSYRWKFAAQIVAAVYVWNAGFRIDIVSHPLGGELDLGMLSLPVTVLWIVAITNAVNLIDGLDGLAVGVALITTLTVGVIAFERGLLGVTVASVTLAGSLAAFLYFNFNPARIFLGDSGSMFIGFVLAVTSVRGSQKGPTAVAILVPFLVLGLPLMDTGFAIVRRTFRVGTRGMRTDSMFRYFLKNYQHVFMADRGHIHHRLIDVGLSHRNAVLVLYGVGSLFALAAFTVVLVKSSYVGLLLFGILGVLMAAFVGLLYVHSLRGRAAAQKKPPSQGPSSEGLSPEVAKSPVAEYKA